MEDRLFLAQDSPLVSALPFLEWEMDVGPPQLASAPKSEVVRQRMRGGENEATGRENEATFIAPAHASQATTSAHSTSGCSLSPRNLGYTGSPHNQRLYNVRGRQVNE